MKWTEPKVRWVGIPIVAVFAMLPNAGHTGYPLVLDYLVSVLFTALYWNGSVAIICYFRRKFPLITQIKQRLIFTSLSVIVWMSFAGIPLKLLFGFAKLETVLSPDEFLLFLPSNLIIALIVSLSYEASFFFNNWQEQFKLNEQLKSQQMRTQYEVLQNQMSPHFLFNSLNTLVTLIPENTNLAVSFAEELSDVYRYILQNKERELVELREELQFVKSYLYLLSLRYPDNLSFEFRIDDAVLGSYIPPLTIQMLVENAIKHNTIGKSKPLHIEIYLERANRLVVKNNLQLKNSLNKSTKTGLDNIKKRYQLLWDKDVDVITSSSSYMVAVPLIDVLEEKEVELG